MQKLPRKIELLAPAKDYETGIAAVACSKDDDDDNLPPVSSSKRLVSIAIGSDGIEDYVYEYDKNGRMISAIEIEDDGSYDMVYSWEGDKVNVEDEYCYTVKNDRFVEGYDFESNETSVFTYDGSSCLKKIVDDYSETLCVWSNGRLSSVIKNEDSGSYVNSYKFYYSDEECNGFFPLLGGFIEDDEHLFRVMPQLIGAVQTALPSKIVRNDDGRTETKTYSYEFYVDGYIKSCTEISSDGDTSVYGFVWE